MFLQQSKSPEENRGFVLINQPIFGLPAEATKENQRVHRSFHDNLRKSTTSSLLPNQGRTHPA
jgi:hypothetical protein